MAPARPDVAIKRSGMRDARLELRLSRSELSAWRRAAGRGGVAELVRVAVRNEIARREQERLAAEQAEVDERKPDPLAELLTAYGPTG